MNIPILETMREYNEAITRYKKAEQFFENPEIPMEQKEKHIPDMQLLTNHLSGMMNKMKDMGYEMTDEEVLQGFRQVKYLEL